MRTASFFSAAMLGVALTGAQWVLAQTVYKLIDKNGKITYSEEKPKNFDGQVIPMNIDPNANTATLPRADLDRNDSRRHASASRKTTRKPNADAAARAGASDRLEKAKAALQNAKDNPGDDDNVDGRQGRRRRAQHPERGLPEEAAAARARREGRRRQPRAGRERRMTP